MTGRTDTAGRLQDFAGTARSVHGRALLRGVHPTAGSHQRSYAATAGALASETALLFKQLEHTLRLPARAVKNR